MRPSERAQDQQLIAFIFTMFSPLQLGDSTYTPSPRVSPYPVYASGVVIDKMDPDAEERSSSLASPLAASVASVDMKPHPDEATNPQVVVTVDTPDSDMQDVGVVGNPDFIRTDGLAGNHDFVRAVSVSSTGSSIIRQSPTPPVYQTEPERELSLRESERLNFPSPPPSDNEFEVPVLQPFKQSGSEIILDQRKAIKSVGDHAPELEWTRLLPEPEPQPTPPHSPTASSTASGDMDIDSTEDVSPDYDEPMDGPEQSPVPNTSRETSVAASQATGRNGSLDEPKGTQAEENDVSRRRRDKDGLPRKRLTKEPGDKNSGKKKELPNAKQPPKEWELREFVAPREDELKESTSPNGREVIPFKDIRILLPPVVNGSDRSRVQASFDQLRRLLYPENNKPPVELYLNQLAWMVNQMAVAGSPEYLAALAKSANLRLLESILLNAYQKMNGPTEKKANITVWRSIKVAYFTIQVGFFPRDTRIRADKWPLLQLLRKLNPSDGLLSSTKLDLRLREWARRDEGEQVCD